MIRPARPDDVPEILALVRELAEYERAAHEVQATEADLHRSLFGPDPAVFCHVADTAPESAGRHSPGTPPLAGFALWFLNYSTWQGRHGIYLEDLYVRPAHQGQGFGRALLQALARVCVEHGYGRLQWWVLDWNSSATAFYSALGAEPMDEWTVWRLGGAPLEGLGSAAGAGSHTTEA